MRVKEFFQEVRDMSQDYVSFHICLCELADKFPKFRFCGMTTYDLKRMGNKFMEKMMSDDKNIWM